VQSSGGINRGFFVPSPVYSTHIVSPIPFETLPFMGVTDEPRIGTRHLSPWFTVWIGFVALALAYSVRALLGVTMPIWEDAGLWSRSWSSTVGFIALLIMGLSAPGLGLLLGYIGFRIISSVGLVLLAIACLLIATTSNPWIFMFSFGVAGGTAFGILSTNVLATAVAWDFEERRGLATGVATAGSTAGQFLIVPLAAVVLEHFTWRWSFSVLAIACFLLTPVALRTPSRLPKDAAAATLRFRSQLKSDLFFLFRNKVFHLLLSSFIICGYTTSGVIETHLLPYASFCGIPPVPSATAYGVLSVVNFLGMVAAGWMTDNLNRPRILATIYFARALAFVILLQIGASFEVLLVFAIAFGAVDYSTVPLTVSLAATHLGLRRLGLVVGLITAGHQIGGALGALGGGALFGLLGNYALVWQTSAGLAFAAALLAWSIPPDRVARDSTSTVNP